MKRFLIIIVSVLFFLGALTFYLNRVVFPGVIKKIAVERMEEALKRRVEVGSIHFNWIKGFIIDEIKIYEKNPADAVFAQADQVSFGVLFFPGFKHSRITIPFINVRSPSVKLIRTGPNTWNFSDMLVPSSPPAAGTRPAVEIAWGGISISNGKCLIDDISSPQPWSEYFDNINLKLSLSYKGISYDFTADIPKKGGVLGATVYYQPITQNTEAQIHLKNIDTASYLSLINIPGIHLESGVIKDIDLNMKHNQDMTWAQGSILMENLDVSSGQQAFKGNVDIRGFEMQYRNNDITAHGQMALNNVQTSIPGLSAGGSVQTKVNDFELTPQGLTFDGSLRAQNVLVVSKDRRVQASGMAIDNISVKKDANGIQSVGGIDTQGLFVQWPGQSLQGDISLKNVTLRMKDENDIRLEGDLQADNFSTRLNEKSFSSPHVLLEGVRLNITDQKNIALSSGLTVDEMSLGLKDNLLISGSIETDRFLFDLDNGIIKTSTTMDISKAKLALGNHKTVEGDPQLELNLRMPLNNPQQLTYKGSVTLSDGILRGFPLLSYLDNIELDADFQNDQATINALNANVLDTQIRVDGTVHDFKNPIIDIVAEADELNLAKIKDLAPRIVDRFGLVFDGTSNVKVKFDGLADDPLSANILAVASVKNVSVYSSKWHQRIKNIIGIVEATPNSLKWRNFTATYQGQNYSLGGSLENFKKPSIFFSIDGPALQLNAALAKNNNLITINRLTGKFMSAAFNGKGTIALVPGKEPFLDIETNASLLLEDLVKGLPDAQRKNISPLNPTGLVSLSAGFSGPFSDWKNDHLNASITSPVISLMGYKLNTLKINIDQDNGQVKNLTLDGQLYGGTVHAVGSMDLMGKGMPYELALNIADCDLHQLKMDSPLKMQEINGKFFLTAIAHGTMVDFKNNLTASGSLAMRDGYLGEFNLFKGLLSVLNEALRLGQVMITDVDGNFTVDGQKITTDNLRLRGPTIVLLGKGWVGFDQMCDLDVTVDLSSGVVPDIAHDVLNSLNIRIYGKLADPKFKRKISMPQVINTLLKNLLP